MSTTTAGGTTSQTESLGTLHYAGIGLAAITGAIHLFLGVQFAPEPLGISFLVAAVGFFGGAAAVLFDVRRPIVYLLGIPFTVGQIALWYLVNFSAGQYSFPADVGAVGAVDKIAQVLFIVVLTALYRREG